MDYYSPTSGIFAEIITLAHSIRLLVESALLSVMAADLGQFVFNLLSRLFIAPVGLLDDLELLDMVQYSRQITWLLLPIILLRQGLQMAANRAEGMPSDSVESFSHRAVLACLAVGGTAAVVS